MVSLRVSYTWHRVIQHNPLLSSQTESEVTLLMGSFPRTYGLGLAEFFWQMVQLQTVDLIVFLCPMIWIRWLNIGQKLCSSADAETESGCFPWTIAGYSLGVAVLVVSSLPPTHKCESKNGWRCRRQLDFVIPCPFFKSSISSRKWSHCDT